MTVLIAGGGIGGLTLALSLHQIGIPARVFESVSELRPLGVGINVLPHAVRELIELGLHDRLDASAVRTKELAYFSKHGKPIWSEPRGVEAGYKWPQFSIHRGQLQQLLLDTAIERLGRDNILTSHHLTGWTETPTVYAPSSSTRPPANRPALRRHTLDRRRRHSFGGARKALSARGPADLERAHPLARRHAVGRLPHRPHHDHGRTRDPEIRLLSDFEAGRRGWKVRHQLGRRAPYAADYQWRREDYNRTARLEEFLPWFEDWQFDWLDVPGLIKNCPHAYEYPLVDRDPVSQWTFGQATLMGDAAHPMYPIGSNGASQAILDARVLTREILAHGPTTAALLAYEAERRPATTDLVLLNRKNGPEQVMQMVEERAPDGYKVVTDVLSQKELEDIAANYKRVAGFQVEALNAKPPIVQIEPAGAA